MMTSRRFAIAVLMSLAAAPLFAHEFWIDSKNYQVETGENIAAFTKNGQNFKGIDLAYFTKRAARFDRVDADGTRPVVARLGDSPVFDKPVDKDGLFTLIYQTTPDRVRYGTWEKFQKFADHKAFNTARAQHTARNLPESDFTETYIRYAKGLFAVGSGAGSDAQRGLEIEIVALKNPYTDDLSDGLPVQVFYREKPRINAQVEIFERPPEGDVVITTVRTNEQGIAIIPVKSGHAYLLDNVALREPVTELAQEIGAVWETLWASLTFEVR
ncbi:DUF4198 domain-containing protein [Planktotalea sp.]|uniref:DUF4198 domain-containing protein n=1 Tax=Planktotalea sp. TaxID=2029877 RepID=UPI0032991B04